MRSATLVWFLAFTYLALFVSAQSHSSASNETNVSGEEQKSGIGKGYGHHDHHGHHHDFIPPFPHEKPFHDTHYCSVHGSFALSYTKTESYPAQYGPPKKHHKRKYLREFCRFSAAHSAFACQFCCKIVARSAYTNPDDIVSAIFAFDPVNPTAGGVGLPRREHKHKHQSAYPPHSGYPQQYGNQPHGYQQKPGYQQHQQQPHYPQSPAPSYPPQQQYRYRRQAEANAPAPPPTSPVAAEAVVVNAPKETQATYSPETESFAPVNQCVCCAPKTHYDNHHHRRHHHHDEY